MHRLHLFEIEDQPWFPSWMRLYLTRVIMVFMRVSGGTRVLTHELRKAVEATGCHDIVDLGSGAGGAMPEVFAALREQDPALTLTMTDLYPASQTVALFEDQGDPKLRYHAEPVSATELEDAPRGLRTMVNSFHHMRPEQARRILATAAASKQPLLVYEIGERPMPRVVWWLVLPLSIVLVGLTNVIFTLMVRPVSLRQLFFTYVIPILPLCYGWDGHVSVIRTYLEEDVRELLSGVDSTGYAWTLRPAQDAEGRTTGFLILGQPSA